MMPVYTADIHMMQSETLFLPGPNHQSCFIEIDLCSTLFDEFVRCNEGRAANFLAQSHRVFASGFQELPGPRTRSLGQSDAFFSMLNYETIF